MSCDRYRQFCLGELDATAFAAHRDTCDACRRAWELDRRIEDQARRLPAPTEAPGLWDRIAAELEAELGPELDAPPRARQSWPAPLTWLDPRRGAWRLAAVLAVAAALTSFLLLRPDPPGPMPRNLLTEEALVRVQQLEAEYESAITDLETLAQPVLATDTELMLRYRARLETIDAQIRRCQDVLAVDCANAHVRRYLLAAYQDKRETLTALLNLAEG